MPEDEVVSSFIVRENYLHLFIVFLRVENSKRDVGILNVSINGES